MKKVLYLILFVGICFGLNRWVTLSKVPTKEKKVVEEVAVSEEIKTALLEVETIIVKKDYDGSLIGTIDDINEIEKIVSIISVGIKVTGDVDYIGASYALEMYKKDGKLIGITKIFNNYVSFESNEYGNNSYFVDVDALIEIIEN